MAGYDVPLTVEQNARGQLARLIRRETGLSVAGTVSRYDGLPFTLGELLTEVEKRLW